MAFTLVIPDVSLLWHEWQELAVPRNPRTSAMLTARLRERVPSAKAIGIGQLVGHALRSEKRSWEDGSGECDAEATSR